MKLRLLIILNFIFIPCIICPVGKPEDERKGLKRHIEEIQPQPEPSMMDHLLDAIEAGNVQQLFILINLLNISINAQDEHGGTLLHHAVAESQLEIIRQLLARGANANIANEDGVSPLLTAFEVGIQDNDFQIAQTLMAVPGIDFNRATNNNRTTVLSYLIANGSQAGIDLLLTPANVARGLNLNVLNARQATPLLLAIDANNTDVAKRLIALGANVNLTTTSGNPLLLAYIKRNLEIIKSLLAAGADPNTLLIGNNTIILDAIARGNEDVVKEFLKANVNVNQQNDNGQTALMLAVLSSSPEIVKLLLEKGADPTLISKNGMTINDYIGLSKNREQLVKLFSELKNEEHP